MTKIKMYTENINAHNLHAQGVLGFFFSVIFSYMVLTPTFVCFLRTITYYFQFKFSVNLNTNRSS